MGRYPTTVRRRIVNFEAGRMRLQRCLTVNFGLGETVQVVSEGLQGRTVGGEWLQLLQQAAFEARG
ncbi:hypothetical protein D3C81_1677060 [compost metagenome]